MKTLQTIESILLDIGVNPALSGFYYILHAVNYFFEHDVSFIDANIMSDVYPYVVSKFKNTSVSRVEKCIRHAVESLYNNGSDTLKNVVGINSGKVTSSSFIAYVLLLSTHKMEENNEHDQ